MNKSRKEKMRTHLLIAKEQVTEASMAAGPVDDAVPDDVTVCILIGNAVEDLTAALKELED
jgi:hypothetical protein